MSYPSSASPGHAPDTSAPLTRRYIMLAGALDQLLMLSVFLVFLYLGLTLTDGGTASGDRTRSIIIASAIGAVIAVVVGVLVQIRAAVRLGTTAGMFVCGIRFDPAEPVDWYADASDWLLSFWENLVLVPLYWLTSRLSRGKAEDHEAFVRDPRARTGAARLARVVLAAAILAPVVVPCVLVFS